MENLEEEYTNRFNNQELPGDDFDVEGLWGEIASELDDTGRKTGWWSFNWKHGLLLLLLVPVSILVVYHIKQNPGEIENSTVLTNQNDELSIDGITEIKPADSLSFNENNHAHDITETTKVIGKENKVNSPNAPIDIEKSNSHELSRTRNENFSGKKNALRIHDNQERETLFSSPSDLNNSEEKTSNSLSQTKKKSSLEDNKDYINQAVNDAVISATTDNANNQTNKETQLSIPNEATDKLPDDGIVLNGNIRSLSDTLELATLPLKPYSLLKESPLPNLELLPKDKLLPDGLSSGIPLSWSFTVISGFNQPYFYFHSQDETATLKEKTEKGKTGYSIGLLTALSINKKWKVSSGLEYHQLHSKFTYSTQRDSQIFKPQALLAVFIDSLGNTVSEQFGDTIVGARIIRQIEHYNKYRLLSIPVEVGFIQHNNKWSYGISGGVAFNFRIYQSGKTLDDQSSVINFSQSDPAAIFEKFGLSLRMSPFINYHLSEHIKLAFRPQWNWSNNQLFSDDDLKVGVHQFNLNMGVEWKF